MSEEPVLIQPLESPVICKPYEEPTEFWEFDRETGRASRQPGRRPASYWYKLSDDELRQRELPLHFRDARGDEIRLELDEGRRDLVLVNKLRKDMKRWRTSGWEGATNVTKDLLRHWSRKDRPRRFFFCQLEAAETIIFLNEIRGLRKDGSRGKPRWNPEFSDSEFDNLLDHPADPEALPLSRMCCKMATGSGKTVVMAMLVTWAFCNRARVPSDTRFPHAALVCWPNLTIKERLQVLRTDGRSEDYYTQFDLVPPQYRDLLRTGQALVTNWHLFAPESEHSEGGKSYAVVQKGEETDEAFARGRLGQLFEHGPIMVFTTKAIMRTGPHRSRRPKQKRPMPSRARSGKKRRCGFRVWIASRGHAASPSASTCPLPRST